MSEYHDEDGFTCHALVGGTVPMRIDTRYHALLALKRRTKQDISNEECMAELKSFFEKPVMTGVLERTPITHFAQFTMKKAIFATLRASIKRVFLSALF